MEPFRITFELAEPVLVNRSVAALVLLDQPVSVHGADLVCVKTALGEPDDDGQRREREVFTFPVPWMTDTPVYMRRVVNAAFFTEARPGTVQAQATEARWTMFAPVVALALVNVWFGFGTSFNVGAGFTPAGE